MAESKSQENPKSPSSPKSNNNPKSRKTSKPHKTITLVIALIVVLAGSFLFAGALAGWFSDTRVNLSPEYYTTSPELANIKASEYEDLAKKHQSFIVFVDQGGCTTADRLREYTNTYAAENGLSIYRIMFSDIKDSSLGDHVKYYPSIAIIKNGQVKYFLRADSDEDADEYNNYDAYKAWLNQRIVLVENSN